MHKRKWPEIIRAAAKPDMSIDVYFEDGKTVNLDLKLLRDSFDQPKEQLTYRHYDSFQVLPHALFWEAQPGYNDELSDEIELSGRDIYNGAYKKEKKETHK